MELFSTYIILRILIVVFAFSFTTEKILSRFSGYLAGDFMIGQDTLWLSDYIFANYRFKI